MSVNVVRGLQALGVCYLLFLVASFILITLIKCIDAFYVVDYLKLPSLLNHNTLDEIKAYTNGNVLFLIFLIAVFVPIIEETIFRLWLSLTANTIAISTSAILISLFFRIRELFEFNKTSLSIICAAMLGYTGIYFLLRRRIDHYSHKNISVKFLGSISAISFGLVHIANFSPINRDIWFLYPIYVLPQITLGYLAVYLRLKHGFLYAVLLHSVINFISTFSQL